MRTVPREVGCRLQALTVIAGKRCSGSPNLSSDSGCTWNWILARARYGSERGKMASLRRRHGQRSTAAEGVIEPHQAATDQRVIGFVQRADALDLINRALLQM